jgi:hypothetical protein
MRLKRGGGCGPCGAAGSQPIHGAQINFGDLSSYLTYGWVPLSVALVTITTALCGFELRNTVPQLNYWTTEAKEWSTHFNAHTKYTNKWIISLACKKLEQECLIFYVKFAD